MAFLTMVEIEKDQRIRIINWQRMYDPLAPTHKKTKKSVKSQLNTNIVSSNFPSNFQFITESHSYNNSIQQSTEKNSQAFES